MSTPAHSIFSISRIRAIASNTLLELVRQKVFYFMLLFAALGIGASLMGTITQFRDQFQTVKDVSLGAMSIFTWLLATLATAMILPKDLEERTLYTILAKPVSRLEYLLGKMFGVFGLLTVAVILMSIFFAGVLFFRGQMSIWQATQEFGNTPEGVAAIAQIKASAYDPQLIPAVLLILMKAIICAVVTLTLSTFATSWIFTVMISIIVYIIGHVMPIAREVWSSSTTVTPAVKLFLGVIAVIFPDFQMYSIVDEIVVGNAVPLKMFIQTFSMGFGYVFVFALIGYILFSIREL